MARPPIDTLPQERLTLELKRAIDVARNSRPESVAYEMAYGRLGQLIQENPTATLREHVLHNLGCGRRHWLRQLSASLRSTHTSLAIHLDLMGKCKRDRLPVATTSEPAT